MADRATIKRLQNMACDMRIDLLTLCHRSGMLHIGGDLSAADISAVLHGYALKYDPKNPKWDGRDRLIMSKGHCGATIYMGQAYVGFFDKEEVFSTYMQLDSRFGMHPCANALNTLETSTGSLGHGLSIAVGMALSAKMDKKDHRVYCVMGDGESAEGSCWEALMAAPAFKLGNLVLFIDRNGLSMDGPTEDIMPLDPYADKFRSFNWSVIEVDGNNMEELVQAIDGLPDPHSDVPTLILARTIKGKGIDFMENNPLWHAGGIDEDELQKCIAQIEAIRQREQGGE